MDPSLNLRPHSHFHSETWTLKGKWDSGGAGLADLGFCLQGFLKDSGFCSCMCFARTQPSRLGV